MEEDNNGLCGDEYESPVSNCCGAEILVGYVCAECKEHCDIEKENE